MRLRIVLLLIAIILGAVAVVAVIAYINNIRATVEEDVENVEVLVAAQNIPKETPVEILITAEAVILEAVPRKYLADGVLISLQDYEGYVVASPINKGEQITSTRFIKPEDLGMAFNIPDDMLAISIPINEIIGVSNLINVGDMVNIIATFKPSEIQVEAIEERPEAEEIVPEAEEVTSGIEEEIPKIITEITKTLLWNVEVLYIGTRIIIIEDSEETVGVFGTGQTREEQSEDIRTVTLAVTPEQSEKLVFTEEMGSVWMALLPVDGVEKEETTGQTYDNIFD
ncbi:MAG: Flp pilus assembly protein CpaB [Actinobacteria bacterium]|nr:Flp pilus assembly protein CpaB [Actinomycetota bacterium]